MREIIEKVIAKQAAFDEFVDKTLPYWRCVAGDLLTRMDAPASVDIEDVVQELLLGAWRGMQRADASKGSVRTWVVLGAVRSAKRWLNRQRGAERNNIRSPSRYPIAADWIERVPEDRGRSAQEQAAELMASMRLARTHRDHAVLEALVRAPDIDSVADALYADPIKRRQLWFSSEQAAQKSVSKTLRRLTKRAAAAG